MSLLNEWYNARKNYAPFVDDGIFDSETFLIPRHSTRKKTKFYLSLKKQIGKKAFLVKEKIYAQLF